MQWEYWVHTIDAGGVFSQGHVNPRDLMSILNSYGRQGWELVSAFDTSTGGGTRLLVLTFKRPIGSDPSPVPAR